MSTEELMICLVFLPQGEWYIVKQEKRREENAPQGMMVKLSLLFVQVIIFLSGQEKEWDLKL